MNGKRLWSKELKVVLMCVLTVISLWGCGKDSNEETKESKDITITFVNGDAQMGTITVKANEKISEDVYGKYEEVEDADFLGWYETPGFLKSSAKDLSKDTFSKDTTLYGNFKANNITEDTRVWYIVGTSSTGSLLVSNWAAASVAEADREQFKLNPTGNATNEFAITINLYEGDQFQIIHDWAWDGQKGHGAFTELDETQMESGGGLSDDTSKSNVNVVMSGNYTITLTTNPDNEAQDTLTVVRNGDVTE